MTPEIFPHGKMAALCLDSFLLTDHGGWSLTALWSLSRQVFPLILGDRAFFIQH